MDSSTGLIQDWEGTLNLLNYGLFQQLGVSSSSSSSSHPSNTSSSSSSSSATITHSSGLSSTTLSSTSLKQAYDKDLQSHPLLLVEPLKASKADREKWCQIVFEQYASPGIFMSRGGVLSIYANARLSGFAVDMGAGGVSILPVQDGYALMGGARRDEYGARVYGGNQLDKIYHSLLLKYNPKLKLQPSYPNNPQYNHHQTNNFHPSVASWHLYDMIRQVKENTSQLLIDNTYDVEAYTNVPTTEYTLPDGTILSIGSVRYAIPELIFNPSLYTSLFSASSTIHTTTNESSLGYVGLHEAIVTSSMTCDPDLRPLLLNNIILTGGHSKYEGIVERLNNELLPITPPGTRPKITVSSPAERSYGSWIGGSILGSMGTIPDLWFTKEEYNEYGNKMLHKKIV